MISVPKAMAAVTIPPRWIAAIAAANGTDTGQHFSGVLGSSICRPGTISFSPVPWLSAMPTVSSGSGMMLMGESESHDHY